MKRLLIAFLTTLICQITLAQIPMAVMSKPELAPDEQQDASAYFRKKDVNDMLCAIIKVTLTNPVSARLVIDPRGGLRPVDSEKRDNGEWWFWLSPTVKSVRFTCDGYTPTDYVGVSLEEGKVYRITLNVASTITQIQEFSLSQYVLRMNIVPEYASVQFGRTKDYEIGSKEVTDGHFDEILDEGTYFIKVESEMYKPYEGKYILNSQSSALDVKLSPLFGYISIDSSPEGADVYLDGKIIGKTPMPSSPKISSDQKHRIQLRLNDYYPSKEQAVSIMPDGQINKLPTVTLRPQFAMVEISCADSDATLTITTDSGKTEVAKGKGTLSAKLNFTKSYKVESSKPSHKSQSIGIEGKLLEEGKQTKFNVGAPVALYGGLQITSVPSRADVYIDGVLIGPSPLSQKILIGNHKVELSKDGYSVAVENVTITHNQTVKVHKELIKGPKYVKVVLLTKEGSGIKVDGKVLSQKNRWEGTLEVGREYTVESVNQRDDSGIYRNGRTVIKISPETGKQYSIPAPSLRKGRLSIKTNLADAKISVTFHGHEREYTGIGEFQQDIIIGAYNVYVYRDGYEPESRSGVAVKDEETTSLTITLKKTPVTKRMANSIKNSAFVDWATTSETRFPRFFINGLVELSGSPSHIGLQATYIKTRLGVYAGAMFHDGVSYTEGAFTTIKERAFTAGPVFRLTSDRMKVDFQTYLGAGFNTMYGFTPEAGIRIGWRRDSKWSLWDLVAGAQYNKNGLLPYAGISVLIPTAPVWGPFALGYNLVHNHLYDEWFWSGELILGFASADETLFGVNVSAVPDDSIWGAYASVLAGSGLSITAGPVLSLNPDPYGVFRFDFFGGLGYALQAPGLEAGLRLGYGFGSFGWTTPMSFIINAEGGIAFTVGAGIYF